MNPFHYVRIAACPSVVGCSSPKKVEDPGGEHTTSFGCSSCRQRGSNSVLVLWWHGCRHVQQINICIVICNLFFFCLYLFSLLHYLNALFLYWGVAISSFFASLDTGIFINCESQTHQNYFLTIEFYLSDQSFEKKITPKVTSGTQRMGDPIFITVSVKDVQKWMPIFV